MKRAATRHEKIFSSRAVHFMNKVENTFVIPVGWFQQDRARAIAEQYAGGTVLIIQDRSHDIAADDQGLILSSGADKLRADGQRIDKSGAGRGKIKSPCVFCAQIVLDQAGRSEERRV